MPIALSLIQALERRRKWLASRGRSLVVPKLPPRHPDAQARQFLRELRPHMRRLYGIIDRRLLPALPSMLNSIKVKLDAYPEDLELLIGQVFAEFGRERTKQEIEAIARRLGRDVSEFNAAQGSKTFKRVLGVDVFRSEPILNDIIGAFSIDNAALITSLSERHVEAVRQIVFRGVRQGVSLKQVEKEISDVVGKTDANLKLIARDQTAKLNGQLTGVRQQSAGISRYIWRTSLDSRVRQTHRIKEGQTFHWNAPPDTGHPGEDYQCRCYAEPIIEDLLDDAD